MQVYLVWCGEWEDPEGELHYSKVCACIGESVSINDPDSYTPLEFPWDEEAPAANITARVVVEMSSALGAELFLVHPPPEYVATFGDLIEVECVDDADPLGDELLHDDGTTPEVGVPVRRLRLIQGGKAESGVVQPAEGES